MKYLLVVLSLPIEAHPVGLERPRVLTGQVYFHVEGCWEKIKYLCCLLTA